MGGEERDSSKEHDNSKDAYSKVLLGAMVVVVVVVVVVAMELLVLSKAGVGGQ